MMCLAKLFPLLEQCVVGEDVERYDENSGMLSRLCQTIVIITAWMGFEGLMERVNVGNRGNSICPMIDQVIWWTFVTYSLAKPRFDFPMLPFLFFVFGIWEVILICQGLVVMLCGR